jgi:hypothetical protein
VAAGVLVAETLSFGDTLERLLEVLLVLLVGVCLARHWDLRCPRSLRSRNGCWAHAVMPQILGGLDPLLAPNDTRVGWGREGSILMESLTSVE